LLPTSIVVICSTVPCCAPATFAPPQGKAQRRFGFPPGLEARAYAGDAAAAWRRMPAALPRFRPAPGAGPAGRPRSVGRWRSVGVSSPISPPRAAGPRRWLQIETADPRMPALRATTRSPTTANRKMRQSGAKSTTPWPGGQDEESPWCRCSASSRFIGRDIPDVPAHCGRGVRQ
jgi:hypothetical protein